MSWVGHLDTAAVCAAAAGAATLWMPSRIAALAEPEPEPEPTPEEVEAQAARRLAREERAARQGKTLTVPEPEPPKEAYADLGARPGLAVRLAVGAALSGIVIGLGLGWDWSLVYWVPLVPLGVALAFVDWNTRLLPTDLVRPAYVIAIVGVVVATVAERDLVALERAALGWLVAGGLYAVLWFIYPPGLGYGDVRLAGVLGITLGYLGWGPLLVGLYAGFLLGGVIGALLRVFKVVRQRHVPFGPFMLISVLVAIAWGEPLWSHFVVTG
ncbi:prepilin peptidase [Nocardioides cynanchi]|uniref:prepilin peptidase n=1 Tax=Nocardioides cynanchi TaxID=2558918 RepID=UPI001246A010|nr:A24 family peptidase [Nocardioides cynanchi]